MATACQSEQPLLFASHRVASATVLEEPSKRPKGFSLDAYLKGGAAQFCTDSAIILKARVSDELARLLEENQMYKDQKITTRTSVHPLTATVQESWRLHF